MKRALCLIRSQLVYRRESFCAGLESAGYKVVGAIADPGPDDLLVIWNRYGEFDAVARRFEKFGATVIVAENGYVRESGKWFALAKSHHSGAGKWNVGGPERWDSIGIELQPWRTGSEIVILGQRGIGEPGIAAPRGWAETVQRQIGGRIRPHPGNNDPTVPLEHDLRNAKAVVTWHSAAALRALILGVPVFCAFPRWIAASAATPLDRFPDLSNLDNLDRLSMFRRLAWAQWRIEEIQTGEAFRCLMR